METAKAVAINQASNLKLVTCNISSLTMLLIKKVEKYKTAKGRIWYLAFLSVAWKTNLRWPKKETTLPEIHEMPLDGEVGKFRKISKK